MILTTREKRSELAEVASKIGQEIGQVAFNALENEENSEIIRKESEVTVSQVTWAAINFGGKKQDENQLGKNSCFSCEAENFQKCVLSGLFGHKNLNIIASYASELLPTRCFTIVYYSDWLNVCPQGRRLRRLD